MINASSADNNHILHSSGDLKGTGDVLELDCFSYKYYKGCMAESHKITQKIRKIGKEKEGCFDEHQLYRLC